MGEYEDKPRMKGGIHVVGQAGRLAREEEEKKRALQKTFKSIGRLRKKYEEWLKRKNVG